MRSGGALMSHRWRCPLLVAGAVSLALHVALIMNLRLELPDRRSEVARILEARLVPMQPVEPVVEAPSTAPEVVKPTPAPRRPKPSRPSARADAPPPPAEIPPEPIPPTTTEPLLQEQAPVTAPAAAEAALEKKPDKALEKKPAAVSMPKRILIHFTVNWGVDGPGVGKAEYRWLRDGNRYELQSITESTGVIALFTAQKLLQTSIGEITENGLQPEAFVIQRGTRRSDSALFDWTEKSLKLVDSENIQTLPLPAGTQDIMSVLFQFAFNPPSQGDIEFSVATGRKLETYRFTVVGEEDLRLAGGRIRALHIRRPKTDTDDGMDVWLDRNRFHLPVKIRSEQRRDSRPIELVASEILVPPEDQ